MDEIRRQMREAADLQLTAAFKEFGEKLDRKLAELTPPEPPAPVEAIEPESPRNSEPPYQAIPETAEMPAKPRNPWGWLALI
jgi:hypothetical protein